MTRPMIQPTHMLPLHKSGIYEFPLRLTEAQAYWLQIQYPVGHTVTYFPVPLSRVQVRQEIWLDSLLFSPVFPAPLAIELSGLTVFGMEALARYTPGETIPAGWAQDAPVRAWLCPDSTCIVARPGGEYRFEFAFWSQRPLFHFGREVERALAFQMDAEVEAERLTDELQQVRDELDRVHQYLESYETQRGTPPTIATPTTARPARLTSRRLVR